MREADFQVPGGYKNPGASPCARADVMRCMTIRMRDIYGQKKEKLSPEESQKAGVQEIL